VKRVGWRLRRKARLAKARAERMFKNVPKEKVRVVSDKERQAEREVARLLLIRR